MQHFSTDEINDFIAYLSETLIPDLKESGRDATAEDFEKCVAIIKMLMIYARR